VLGCVQVVDVSHSQGRIELYGCRSLSWRVAAFALLCHVTREGRIPGRCRYRRPATHGEYNKLLNSCSWHGRIANLLNLRPTQCVLSTVSRLVELCNMVRVVPFLPSATTSPSILLLFSSTLAKKEWRHRAVLLYRTVKLSSSSCTHYRLKGADRCWWQCHSCRWAVGALLLALPGRLRLKCNCVLGRHLSQPLRSPLLANCFLFSQPSHLCRAMSFHLISYQAFSACLRDRSTDPVGEIWLWYTRRSRRIFNRSPGNRSNK